MRIKAIDAKDVPPVRLFSVDGLTDVVVLAGRNGVGKTRLLKAVLQTFQPGSASGVRLTIEATTEEERKAWGKPQLNTADAKDMRSLALMLQRNQRRRNWRSGVMYFESDRTIQQIKPYVFSFDAADPWEESIKWDLPMGGLRQRFQDTVHSMFRKKHQLRNQLASTAERLRREGKKEMKLNFSDPLEAFKEAFHLLLAPKQLVDPDPRRQKLQYELEGQTFDLLVSLSSGEREVINIVFDVLLRKPSDCVIFFDEPELHLHPDLSYRLINTLRSIGDRNQLVLCTHSPDIISASLDQSVVFIGPPRSDGGNQAMVAKQDDEANYALRALGQSIGVIALGQRVVLIEGTGPSLDRQTYGSIIRDRFPNLALAPSEGRDLIASFSALNEKVLQRTIWGVDFFMLCDRDAIPPGRDARGIEEESNGRLRLLPRYHLENYFLDAECLAAVFERIEPDEAWLRDPDQVEAVLREEARHSLAFAASLYVSADLRDRVGNAAVLPSRCHDANRDSLKELFRTSVAAEESRIGVILAPDAVVASVEDTWSRLESSLGTDEWRELIPGRPVLQRFAARAHLEYGRVKTGYLQAARDRDDEPFADILKIFEHFSTA